MTGRSFHFDAVDALVPGTVGEPGSRIFYLQARRGNEVVSLRLEKEQVGMLGQYLGQLAQAMGAAEPERDIAGLIEPVTAEWVVGSLAVGVDEDAGLIFVTAEELVVDDFDEETFDPDDFDDDDIDELLESDPDAAEAHFTLRLGQAVAFAETAMDLVRAGRPPCQLCGRPIGAEGHACPRWN
ncbi:MAG: DUF3090 family protein [Actinobacteria bacterium]|nr:DUF3090 family protein [Actinomycetota bacterium]